MTEPLPEAAPLPIDRDPKCPFDPPPGLKQLREQHPLSRMAYSDGHVGWLATGHAVVRAVLGDLRFSSRHELLHYPFPGGEDIKIGPAPVGYFTAMDPPEHTAYRRLLAGKFTVRRMAQLTARVEQISAEHLDAMERHGPPVDLVQFYGFPIPALTICELLGVPHTELEMFQRVSAVNALEATADEVVAAMTTLHNYVCDLVAAKRTAPTDDLRNSRGSGPCCWPQGLIPRLT
jgi:cytochrome P450